MPRPHGECPAPARAQPCSRGGRSDGPSSPRPSKRHAVAVCAVTLGGVCVGLVILSLVPGCPGIGPWSSRPWSCCRAVRRDDRAACPRASGQCPPGRRVAGGALGSQQPLASGTACSCGTGQSCVLGGRTLPARGSVPDACLQGHPGRQLPPARCPRSRRSAAPALYLGPGHSSLAPALCVLRPQPSRRARLQGEGGWGSRPAVPSTATPRFPASWGASAGRSWGHVCSRPSTPGAPRSLTRRVAGAADHSPATSMPARSWAAPGPMPGHGGPEPPRAWATPSTGPRPGHRGGR